MKLNNRGIAITSVVYMILVLGIILILTTLGMLSSRKLVLDKIKKDTYSEIMSVEEITTYYPDGTEVYFNVTTGKKCDTDASLSTVGTNVGCMKFYAFGDDAINKTKINLILDHNTTAYSAWTDLNTEENTLGPINVLEHLKNDTQTWVGVLPQPNYVYSNYRIDYTGLNARLITIEEINTILGINTDMLASGYVVPNNFNWLFDRTSTTCTSLGCPNNSDVEVNGYWTSTSESTLNAWGVGPASLESKEVNSDANYGIRPVITVDKAKLK